MSKVKLTDFISLELPDEVKQQILALIAQIQALLQPHLAGIGPRPRRGIVALGDGNVAFVSKILGYLQANPQLCPPYLDVPEFARDLAGYHALRSIVQPLQALVDQLKLGARLCGSDACSAALVGYDGFQTCASLGLPGASTIVADCATQFAQSGGRGGSTDPGSSSKA